MLCIIKSSPQCPQLSCDPRGTRKPRTTSEHNVCSKVLPASLNYATPACAPATSCVQPCSGLRAHGKPTLASGVGGQWSSEVLMERSPDSKPRIPLLTPSPTLPSSVDVGSHRTSLSLSFLLYKTTFLLPGLPISRVLMRERHFETLMFFSHCYYFSELTALTNRMLIAM